MINTQSLTSEQRNIYKESQATPFKNIWIEFNMQQLVSRD